MAPSDSFGETPPPVTVVVPAYNREQTLRIVVSSVLANDYPDFELVVVDDGSSDGTAELVRTFAAEDHRVRLVRHEQNSGVATARNTGVAHANGEYIIFTDDDVKVPSDWIRNHIRHHLDGDGDVVGGWVHTPRDLDWFGQAVGLLGLPNPIVVDGKVKAVPTCNASFPKALIVDVGGFDPRFVRTADDLDFNCRLSRRNLRIIVGEGLDVEHYHRSDFKGMLRWFINAGTYSAKVLHKYGKEPEWKGWYDHVQHYMFGKPAWRYLAEIGVRGTLLFWPLFMFTGMFLLLYRHGHPDPSPWVKVGLARLLREFGMALKFWGFVRGYLFPRAV
jgi:glycosyltransferase involved in cell wall biosynthesis